MKIRNENAQCCHRIQTPLTPLTNTKVICMNFQLWNPSQVACACQILHLSTVDCSVKHCVSPRNSSGLQKKKKGKVFWCNPCSCLLLPGACCLDPLAFATLFTYLMLSSSKDFQNTADKVSPPGSPVLHTKLILKWNKTTLVTHLLWALCHVEHVLLFFQLLQKHQISIRSGTEDAELSWDAELSG